MVQEVDSEDFASLLDKYLPDTDIETGIDQGRNLFGIALNLKREGALERSYTYFTSLYGSSDRGRQRLTARVRHLVVKNLADISVQMVNRVSDEERLPWIGTAYSWFDQLPHIKFDEEPPQSRLHTALQLGKLKHRHHFLVGSTEEKRQLLLEGYASIDSVRDIIPQEQQGWQFMLHSSLHLIARAYCRFINFGEPERRVWLQRWFDEAIISASIPSRPGHDLSPKYLSSAAHAAEFLALEEQDPTLKLKFLRQSYQLMAQAIDLEDAIQEDPKYLIKRVKMARRIALSIAQLTADSAEREQLLTDSNKLVQRVVSLEPDNKVGIGATFELLSSKIQEELLAAYTASDLANQIRDSGDQSRFLKTAYTSFAMAAEFTGKLALLVETDEADALKLKEHDYLLESAMFALQANFLKHTSHSYSLASQVSEDIAARRREKQQKIFWLEKCAEERLLSAEYAFKAGDFRHAAMALGLAGKICQLVEDMMLSSARDQWAQKAYQANVRAGQIWKQIGENERAERSFNIANKISQRINEV